ncbi:MAG: hypothetical protein FGM15_11545 [Chthoniobacterales bacterium]|nr:hypothetical protein [Chthoniobacterales bacterium]
MRLLAIRGDVTAQRIIDTGNAYHITRGLWSNINKSDFIGAVKNQGWGFQGTLNGNTPNPDYALRDRDGRPLKVKSSSRWWADPSNPGYRKEYLQKAKQWIDNGATSLQRDDPEFGVRQWRDKRDPISGEELLEFYRWAREQIEQYAGGKITMSFGDFGTGDAGMHSFRECFDYRITETHFNRHSPSYLLRLGREAREQGRLIVVSGMEQQPVEMFRLALAGCYATGSLFVLPWDQFNIDVLKDRNAKRVFIEPEHLADLSGFVRANAGYLDGYADAAVGGYDLKETRYGNEEPVRVEGGSGKLSAFLRAKPGDPAAPVVVHLVEWGQATPARLFVDPARLFPGRPVRISLRTPKPYDAAAHTQAQQAGDYQTLVDSRVLEQTDDHRVAIPPLGPWGLVVIEDATQPALVPVPGA